MNWKVLPRPQMMPAQKAMILFQPQSLRYAMKLDLGAPRIGLYRKMMFRVKETTAHNTACSALLHESLGAEKTKMGASPSMGCLLPHMVILEVQGSDSTRRPHQRSKLFEVVSDTRGYFSVHRADATENGFEWLTEEHRAEVEESCVDDQMGHARRQAVPLICASYTGVKLLFARTLHAGILC